MWKSTPIEFTEAMELKQVIKVTPNSIYQHPYQKEKFGHTQTHRGKTMGRHTGRSIVTEVMHLKAKKFQGLPANTRSYSRQERILSSIAFMEIMALLTPSFWTSVSRTVGKYVSADLCHPVLNTLLQKPQETDTHT